MPRNLRWLIPLCATGFLWAFAFGVQALLASLWLQKFGIGDTGIGLNAGTYYLGVIVAAGFVPRLLRWSGTWCLALGMAVAGLTVAAFPWENSLPGWFLLRALNGVASALCVVACETYINHSSEPDMRARNFGWYAVCIALGIAVGYFFGMQLFASWPRTAFLLGGIAPLVGVLVVFAWRPQFPQVVEEHGQAPLSFTRNFLGFGSGWSQGFLEGCMVGLLPVYLLAVGFSDDAASWLLGGLMIGVILAQVPLAWLADRLGRARVLIGCNVIALIALGCLLVPAGLDWLSAWLFVVSIATGAFYPLGLALLGERVPPSGAARANAWYLAINCFGCLIGPSITGITMDLLGRSSLFVVGIAAIGLVVVVWLALEIRTKYADQQESPPRPRATTKPVPFATLGPMGG